MRFLLAAAPLLFAATASAQPKPYAETVRCAFGDGKPQPCRLTGSVGPGQVHRLTFTSGNRRATFVGRADSGWWSGRLNGKPAMGYERNRGNMTIATTDLSTRFEWFRADAEHGSY